MDKVIEISEEEKKLDLVKKIIKGTEDSDGIPSKIFEWLNEDEQ